ncbi:MULTISPECIES: cell division protein FtsL [Bacillaceae]|uniref:cell division protein FtsL n=1 Tax=Bacillaceae TaxID=186817 RepID=UPI001BDDEE40|nr:MULTISPECIES: cell division protein FtsL [Bacillaceae]MDX8359993.1 cell division protein FtsL [Cytobacillus sp. IB215316]
MSNLAHRVQEQRQHEVKHKRKLVKKKSAKISLGEKCILLMFATAILVGGITIISNTASIYALNKEIQQTETSIAEQGRVNTDLQVEIQELSTYERIWQKAQELGLQLNEKNVKVVQD